MIDTPTTSIETVKQQGPTVERIISILAISGLLGYMAIQFFRFALFFRKSKHPGARPRAIVATITGFSFVAIILFYILVGIDIINF